MLSLNLRHLAVRDILKSARCANSPEGPQYDQICKHICPIRIDHVLIILCLIVIRRTVQIQRAGWPNLHLATQVAMDSALPLYRATRMG